MLWLTLIAIGLRLLLVLIQPHATWMDPGLYVGQCPGGQCGLPGRVVSYSPYGVGDWQPAINQVQFQGAQIIGQPVLVNTKPCEANGCRVPNCGPNDCKNCPNCYVQPQWVPIPNTPGQWAKYEGGQQVGGYDESSGVYRPYANGQWGDPVQLTPARTEAPTPKPAPATEKPAEPALIQQGPQLPDFMRRGVNEAELSKDCGGSRECYWLNGKRVGISEGGASSDPSVPDSSKRCYVMIADKDKSRAKQLEEAIAAGPLGKECWVKSFTPEAWQLKPFALDRDTEFQRTGQVVMLQGPPDKEGEAKVLDKAYGDQTSDAITQRFQRRINPNYDPNKPASGGGVDLGGNHKLAFLLIALPFAALILLPTKQEE